MWNSKNEASKDFYVKTFLCHVIPVFVYKQKMYKKMSLKNSKTLKSPAWNACAAIFKNADFS